MDDLQIREVLLSDAEGIAKVHVHTWQDAYLNLIPDSFLQSLNVEQRTTTWISIIENLSPNANILVAELNYQIVGFVSVGANRDNGPTDQGEIFAIYVDPKIQGRGVGSSLMTAGLQALRNELFATAILWVLESNSLTRAWYASHDWMADGAIKMNQRVDFLLTEVRYAIVL